MTANQRAEEVISIDTNERGYFINSAREWYQQFFADIPTLEREQILTICSAENKRTYSGEYVHELMRSRLTNFSNLKLEFVEDRNRSSYQDWDRRVVLDARWQVQCIGAAFVIAHEWGHALQRERLFSHEVQELRESSDGLIAHEVDATRKAFTLIQRFFLYRNPEDLYFAKVLAKYGVVWYLDSLNGAAIRPSGWI